MISGRQLSQSRETGISEGLCRLLIVEDDRALRRMLRWEFEELGYQVVTAACCRSALTAAASQKFDLALLDYNLPDGVGTELLAGLQLRIPMLPAVICSGRLGSDDMGQIEHCATSRFVAKPMAASALHEVFVRLLINR